MSREAIRKAALGSGIGKPLRVVINFPGSDEKVEIRQLTLFETNALAEKSMNEANVLDRVKLIINTVILSTYVPGTDSKIFDYSDYNSIAATAAGGVFDDLYSEINNTSDISLEDAKKN